MNIEAVLDAKEYPPTDEQRSFVETVVGLFQAPRSDRHFVVASAVAGAGKTATVLDIYNVINQEYGRQFYQLVAFNVDAKEEMITRGVNPKHAKTLNGLGHANLSRFAKSRGIKLVVEEHKTNPILRKLNKDLYQIGAVRRFARSLVDFSKSEALLRPSDNRLGRLAHHYEVFIDMTDEELEQLDTTIEQLETEAYQWVRETLAYGSEVPSSGEWIIDYNDQVFLPVVLKLNCFQNDMLIVDEAQDLSVADKKLVFRCLKTNGLLVLVGDDYQCIYAWRGCQVNSLQATIAREDINVVECPLTYNFRSCEEIINEAQNDCPHIRCGTGRNGVVRTLPVEEFDVLEVADDSAVLSRTRAPLVAYAIDCLKADKPFTFRFSLKFLVEMVNMIAEGNQDLQIRSFRRRLNTWVAERTRQLEINDAEQALNDLNDNVAILETIIDKNVVTTSSVYDLVQAILLLEGEIKESNGGVKLSTMHGSKGLEWSTTYLLGFEDIGKNCYREWKQIEARNLRLVARTRAKNEMVYLKGAA